MVDVERNLVFSQPYRQRRKMSKPGQKGGIDDILIGSKKFEGMYAKLEIVLTVMRKYRLTN